MSAVKAKPEGGSLFAIHYSLLLQYLDKKLTTVFQFCDNIFSGFWYGFIIEIEKKDAVRYEICH